MKVARVETPDGDVLEGRYDDGVVETDVGTFDTRADEASLLAPCEPSALYCVGRNYGETVEQMGYEIPDEPSFFIKPPTSVLGPGEPIEYPSFTEELTYAGELAAVVGRTCHDIEEDEVDDYVRGYTVLNDLDALDQQGITERKAFDGSAPLGPCIETDIDPADVGMETYVAGERRQSDTTASTFFGPREVVAYLSERFTFRRNDVISFGSPANPGLLEPGDEVEITYEGVGTLRNTVAD
jgi:2-keto-4-pentenoate hydratase/2-oxohepta-3-ene-1,7-dioic acid hydratase in catechol pathway